jgi:hypothetical protein
MLKCREIIRILINKLLETTARPCRAGIGGGQCFREGCIILVFNILIIKYYSISVNISGQVIDSDIGLARILAKKRKASQRSNMLVVASMACCHGKWGEIIKSRCRGMDTILLHRCSCVTSSIVS